VQTPSAQLSWSQNIALWEKVESRELQTWYADRAVQNGWSLAVLEYQICTGLHEHIGAAPNSLGNLLPAGGIDLARDVARDPLVLDFLGLGKKTDERALDEGMTLRMSQTLAEFGENFYITCCSIAFRPTGSLSSNSRAVVSRPSTSGT
jgi:predicted nuclease of restriction endonuclease-like (RecB) superfamily